MQNIINSDVKFDRIKKIYKKYLNIDNSYLNELPLHHFLSDWDPGSDYINKLKKIIYLQPFNSKDENIYKYKNISCISDHLHIKNLLLRKVVISNKNNINELDLLATPDGTSSMQLLFYMMSINHVKKLCIVSPSYYLVETYCKIYNIKYDLIWLNESNNFLIPINDIIKNNYDAVWITSPLFGTSIGFNIPNINRIQFLINQSLYCFFDESMYDYRHELIQHLSLSQKSFFIYSPHKAISINNGLKFSIVISTKESIKNLQSFHYFCPSIIFDYKHNIGINHFLHVNYDLCWNMYKTYFEANLVQIKKFISNNDNIKLLQASYPHSHTGYVTIIITKPIINIYNVIEKIIKYSGYAIIPSDEHYYGVTSYFSFRVNVLLNKDVILDGLTRILKLI